MHTCIHTTHDTFTHSIYAYIHTYTYTIQYNHTQTDAQNQFEMAQSELKRLQDERAADEYDLVMLFRYAAYVGNAHTYLCMCVYVCMHVHIKVCIRISIQSVRSDRAIRV